MFHVLPVLEHLCDMILILLSGHITHSLPTNWHTLKPRLWDLLFTSLGTPCAACPLYNRPRYNYDSSHLVMTYNSNGNLVADLSY